MSKRNRRRAASAARAAEAGAPTEQLTDAELTDAELAAEAADVAVQQEVDAEAIAADAGARTERHAGHASSGATDDDGVPALDVLDLEKAYGDLVALAPLSLEVPIGQSVALIGHNGSGKSTFLRMVAGLLEPSGGELEVHGWPVGSPEARASISYLPDDPVLYDDLSVREHVEYVSRLHGGGGWDSYAEELVERLGLAARVDDLPARFSRGLRQKTSLVLGLVRPFSVLLVDEPFVGLDASGRAALLELLEETHADGAAVLVATHDPAYVERVDRSLALRDGELVFDGQATVADVLRLVNA